MIDKFAICMRLGVLEMKIRVYIKGHLFVPTLGALKKHKHYYALHQCWYGIVFFIPFGYL